MLNTQTDQSKYMYSDVTPIIPILDLDKLKQIENKLKKYTSGNKNIGLNKEEFEMFLNWVTYNARTYAVKNIPLSIDIAITSEPMTTQCWPTQNINVKLLKKLGLNVYPFNMGTCIDKIGIPMSSEDSDRVKNGWCSTAVRHSITIVTLPRLMTSGEIQEVDFLLDPTFRQFCLTEINQSNLFTDSNWLKKGYVAPRPAFFMDEDLCKEIIRNGYFWLEPKRAKLYGDAFIHASVRKDYQQKIPDIQGSEYINIFKNSPIDLLEDKIHEKAYTLLPSEIEIAKRPHTGSLRRIICKLFPPGLPSSCSNRASHNQFTNQFKTKSPSPPNIIISPSLNDLFPNTQSKSR